jgi:hypothetical protein
LTIRSRSRAELVRFPSVRGAEQAVQDFVFRALNERRYAMDRFEMDEAALQSMVALIEHGALNEALPAYWAPFVVVGEGSVRANAPKPLATSSIIPEPQPPTKATPSAERPRPSKRLTPPDWRSEVWRR